MPLSKIEDVRKLGDQELAEQIVAIKRQMFDLRLQKATRRLEKPHQIKHARHRLGQLMTVEAERQRLSATAEKSQDESKAPDAPEE